MNGVSDEEARMMRAYSEAREKPPGILLRNRQLLMGTGNYGRSIPILTELLNPLLESGNELVYPAVDLAAGSCVYTVAWARYFRSPRFKAALEWYPTDHTGNKERSGGPLETDLRKTLRFLRDNCDPLFADRNGLAVFAGDSVRLEGLKSDQYNRLEGVVAGPDPQNEGRFAIQLDENMDWKSCSFKASNIVRDIDLMGCEDAVKFDGVKGYAVDRKCLHSNMLERSCEIDMLNEKTWVNLAPVDGKCALVTCTNLMCAISYRAPEVWKDCLVISAKLLRPGGVFMAEDVLEHANPEDMVEFVRSKGLDLQLMEGLMGSDGESMTLFWGKT